MTDISHEGAMPMLGTYLMRGLCKYDVYISWRGYANMTYISHEGGYTNIRYIPDEGAVKIWRTYLMREQCSKFALTMAWWRGHKSRVNVGIMSLTESMLTYHQRFFMAFLKKGLWTSSEPCVRWLLFWNCCHDSQWPLLLRELTHDLLTAH